MKKILGFLFVACIAISANAQLLWKVTGNGLDKPSYIFGTHHVAPVSILDEVPGFWQAFDETSQVIGELVMSEMMSPESISLMQKYMIMEGDTTLKMLFTADEFEMINKFTKENLMVDLEMASKLKPSFITNNIAVVLAMKTFPDYNPQMQLDTYLQQKGQEKNKTVDGFETNEFQLNLLFNGKSLQRDAELLLCAINNIESGIEDTKELAKSYVAQDIEALYKMFLKRTGDHCDPLPGEMEVILDDRNVRWAEVFPDKVKAGPAFIVVGAGHLPGPMGILNLLKEKGYTVEAVK